jgi:hypothetical protein
MILQVFITLLYNTLSGEDGLDTASQRESREFTENMEVPNHREASSEALISTGYTVITDYQPLGKLAYSLTGN